VRSGVLCGGPHKPAHPVGVDAGCGPRVVHVEAPYQRYLHALPDAADTALDAFSKIPNRSKEQPA